MRLPFADQAVVTDRKITHYLLSEEHPEGRAKARFFRSLGFDRDRPDELREALRELAMEGDLIETKTEFGVKHAGIGFDYWAVWHQSSRTYCLDAGCGITAARSGHGISAVSEENSMPTDILKELELAALREDLPSSGLVAGDVGTVVLVYGAGEAYEVEFVAADGNTIAVETLSSNQVEPFSGKQILHARKLAPRAKRAGSSK